jgi:hypothetical protein
VILFNVMCLSYFKTCIFEGNNENKRAIKTHLISTFHTRKSIIVLDQIRNESKAR